MRRFAVRYGWRAYALPLLTLVTLLVLVDPNAIEKTSASVPHASGVSAPQTHAGRTKPGSTPSGATTQAPAQQFNLGTDSTPCTANTEAQLVLVSIERQRAWMCAGRTQVYSTLVTTGAANVGNGTPLGTWHIQDKQTNRYLVGPGYRDFVKFWMPFDGDFGFHDASWQTMPYGSPGYRANGSHGCVHLPLPAMRWFFDWADTNTTVTIQA